MHPREMAPNFSPTLLLGHTGLTLMMPPLSLYLHACTETTPRPWERNCREEDATRKHHQVQAYSILGANKLIISTLLSRFYGSFSVDEKTTGLVMELCETDLSEFLDDRTEFLPWPEMSDFCRQLMSGLNFLHQHNIVHRDLKPKNILLKKVGPDSHVLKLTDFGFALQRTLKSMMEESATLSVMGTRSFMAPELKTASLAGETATHYGKSADIFSAGLIAYNMLTVNFPSSKLVCDDMGKVDKPNNIMLVCT